MLPYLLSLLCIGILEGSASTSVTDSEPRIIAKMQPIGPHGGHIVEDQEHRFEVKVSPESKTISIYTLKSKKSLPKSMSIVLFQNEKTGQTVQLKAVDPSQALPQYQGQIVSAANAPYIGIAIRID